MRMSEDERASDYSKERVAGTLPPLDPYVLDGIPVGAPGLSLLAVTGVAPGQYSVVGEG
jgi:hypothetical protein